MNQAITQAELNNQLTAETVAPTDNIRRHKRHTYEYKPDSVWSNIRYFLGMLAAIVIPPLIPGVTSRGLIIAYAGIVIGIYILAFITRLVMSLRQEKSARVRRR